MLFDKSLPKIALDFFHINIFKYIYMKETLEILKLLSDESRVRILMLLEKTELCVCQIMGILNISQPLISRNLSLLEKAGFLGNRKQGKLIFYTLRKNMPKKHSLILSALKEALKSEKILLKDVESLNDCEEFRKKTGRCDMETFLEYMKIRHNARRS